MSPKDLEQLFRLDVLINKGKATQLQQDQYECLMEYWIFNNARSNNRDDEDWA